MKKKILALLLALVIGLLALTSCDILWGDVADEGKVTVVVENADGTYEVHNANLDEVENKSEGAKGIIQHLNKNSNLHLEMVDSTYGAYVSAIGSIKESFADNKYVMVYTSVAADSYEGAPTVQYEGVTLYQAGVGLSGMTVEEGTVILFRLEASPY